MKAIPCLFVVTFAVLSSALQAQVTASVGPSPAPLGVPISIVVSNDTEQELIGLICNYKVYDANGAVAFAFEFCPAIAFLIKPGDELETQWDQTDISGQQVPTGPYTVEVFLPDGSTEVHTLVIGGTDAALTLLGAAKTGQNRPFRLVAPDYPKRVYVMAASFGGGQIVTCAGDFPLNPDPLLSISLVPNGGVFQNFIGVLNVDGESTEPSLNLPYNPALVGLPMAFAYVLLDEDPDAACPIEKISSPLQVGIF